MSSTINYELDIRFPDQSPHRVEIEDKISIGGSEKSDLCIEDYNLSPRHLSFRVHNGVLSLHNLGGTNKTHLGSQELLHGKMYILNIGDSIKLGDIEIFIREGEANQEVLPENLKKLFNEETDSAIPSQKNELLEFESNSEEKENEDKYEDTDKNIEKDSPKFQNLEPLNDPEPKESTLVEKITSIFKVKKQDLKKDIIKNNKKNKKRFYKPAAGFFTRLFSALSLLAISYTVVDQVFPIFDVSLYLQKYLSDIQKLISPFPYTKYITDQVIQVLMTYLLIDLLTTLLLGINITYLLLGVRSEGGGIVVKRIKGIIRSLLGLITTPFLIFDLPAIVKKRTLKEVLSGTKLLSPSRIAQLFGFLIILPLTLLSPLYTPVIINFENFVQVSPIERQSIKHSKKAELSSRDWLSANMNMTFSKKLPAHLVVLPSIKTHKEKVITSLTFSSTKNLNSKARLSYIGHSQFFKKLSTVFKLNPMFETHYPELIAHLNKESSNELSPKSFEELSHLVKNSLSLNIEDVVEVFLNHGPFVQDLIKINNFISTELGLNANSSLSIFTGKDKVIITNRISNSKNYTSQHLILFRSGDSLKYSSSGSKIHSKYLDKELGYLLQNITPYNAIKQPFPSSWSNTLDLLTSISETKKDLTSTEADQVYKYYYNFTRRYLSEIEALSKAEKEILVKNHVLEIDRLIDYINEALEFETLPNILELKNFLEQLKESFQNENTTFFSEKV